MTSPKVPTPKKINPYEGMTSDPEFAAAAAELGYTNVNKDTEVAAVRELLIKKTASDERRNKDFVRAERQLYREGILETNDPFVDKKSWKEHYMSQNNLKGKKGQKAATQAYRDKVAESGKDFIYADDTDRDWEVNQIYQRVADNEAARSTRKNERQLKKQLNAFTRGQEKMAEQNQKMMEDLMNQPVYQPRQAAMPTVQYKPKTPERVPVAPAPPPTMNITPAPAPELVNMGNPMGIVRQSNTARSRSRQRTRGTSTLTN